MITFLKSILPFLRPFLGRAIAASLCAIPLAMIKTYQAYLVKPIFDKGLNPNTPPEKAMMLAALLFGLALINYPLRYMHFYGMRMVVERATCLIRMKLYQKFGKLPVHFFNQQKQGDLISRTINDTLVFAEGFKHSIDVIREPLIGIGMLGLAFYHDPMLTLIILVTTPLFLVVFNITGKKARHHQGHIQFNNAEMTQNITEGLIGQKIIKAFNLEKYILKRFNDSQDRYLVNRRKITQVEEHSHPLVETVGALAFAGVIIFAHYRISSGQLTTGGFISFITALALFMDPIRKFSSANVAINRARGAGERIFEILGQADEPDHHSESLPTFKEKIEIKNLSFEYESQSPILKNFSMTIKKGQRIGLVGLSGSGKSTLINLLLRLYQVPNNTILIDGIDINHFKLSSLRNLFALVSQDIFLFNDTVLENITTGDQYSAKDINEALEISYAQEFISKLPLGLETIIGDRGLRLSGGQAQRLTIARAFLKNCPILLFDEATSALDNESEKIVQKALDKVAGDKTVIAVAHRLSTIQNYDHIIVLKEGEKIEEGTHQQLMASNGEYYKLYQLSQA